MKTVRKQYRNSEQNFWRSEPARQHAARQTSCRHCGAVFQPLTETEHNVFCCHGCESVYRLLQTAGLDQYYHLRQADGVTCPIPSQNTQESFDAFDDTEFINRISTHLKSGRQQIELFLEGMNCSSCLWLLERLPALCPNDVAHVEINMARGTIRISRTAGGSFAKIARMLDRLGYPPHVLTDHAEAEDLQQAERRRDLIRLGIAGAATGNVMIMAVSLYAGANGTLADQFHFYSALLALPVLTYCAWPFYKSAWTALRIRYLNLDVPIAAALLSGIIVSLWGLYQKTETLYFDSLSTLVFLLLASRFWLKGVQQNLMNTSRLAEDLLVGTATRICDDGRYEKISTFSLRIGDRIKLSAPCLVPIDGQVLDGNASLNTSILTGESLPIAVSPKQDIEAGTRLLSGTIVVRVQKTVANSRLANILRDTEHSAKTKSRSVQLAEKVSQWFIGTVLVVALGLCIFYSVSNPHEGVARALSLIIVTCPCVFGMAIPLSMSLAIRAAANRGLVIKDAETIERLWSIRSVFFDKTGTLTTGDYSVLRWDIHCDADQFATHAAAALALEEGQTHPVAQALVRALRTYGLTSMTPRWIRFLPDGGIEGEVNGAIYSIKPVDIHANQIKHDGSSQIKARYLLSAGDQPIATVELGDQIRPDAKPLISWLQKHGYKTYIVSGDKTVVAKTCGQSLEIPLESVFGETSPEAKSILIKAQGAQAMMVGDGANDAAALASAGVGVAIRGSIDISLRAADIYLTQAALDAIPDLFEIALRTRHAIFRNLIFSTTFNVVSGALAVSGLMTPLWAAVLMPLSSLTVLLSALMTSRRSTQLNPRLKTQFNAQLTTQVKTEST